MSSWTPQDWSMFFVAIGTLITAVLSAVAAFLANLAKLKSESNAKQLESADAKVEHALSKIEDNTKITLSGTRAATENAKVAAESAAHAKTTAESINKKLNGGIDSAIAAHVEPVQKMLEAHIQQDDENARKVDQQLQELKKYMQQVGHDTLNAVNAQVAKIGVVLETVKQLNQSVNQNANQVGKR